MNSFRDMFEAARMGGYAIGHFNFSNLEILKGIFQAAVNVRAPVLLGTSEGERNYMGLHQAVAMVRAFREVTGIPSLLTADHSKSVETAKQAIDAGYDYILIDASEHPYEENVRMTKEVVEYARTKNSGVLVEGELGYLRGTSEILKEAVEIKPEDMTNPEQARDFVKQTGIDALAVVVGNLHGIEADMENPPLNLERLKAIREAVDCFLVLHGGSGTPEADVREAVKIGIQNFHVNTEIRVAYARALAEAIQAHPGETTPYKFMPGVVEAVKKVVEEKIRLCASANKITSL